MLASIDASLQRLGLDYVDLYQIHRWDYATPIEETMEALHDVVKAGKARYIGASSMFAWQFAKAQAVAERHGWTRFVSMQNHYNLVYREEEREMIPQCIDQGVAVLPWSPLARGLLAGNRTRDGERLTTRAETDPFGDSLYVPEVDFDVVDRVDRGRRRSAACRTRRSRSPGSSASPGVTAPIVGATKVAHVEDALAAEQLELTADEVDAARGAVRAARGLRARVAAEPRRSEGDSAGEVGQLDEPAVRRRRARRAHPARREVLQLIARGYMHKKIAARRRNSKDGEGHGGASYARPASIDLHARTASTSSLYDAAGWVAPGHRRRHSLERVEGSNGQDLATFSLFECICPSHCDLRVRHGARPTWCTGSSSLLDHSASSISRTHTPGNACWSRRFRERAPSSLI